MPSLRIVHLRWGLHWWCLVMIPWGTSWSDTRSTFFVQVAAFELVDSSASFVAPWLEPEKFTWPRYSSKLPPSSLHFWISLDYSIGRSLPFRLSAAWPAMQKAKSSLFQKSLFHPLWALFGWKNPYTFSAHKHKMICISETQGIVPSLATALEVSLGPRDDQGKLLPHQELRRDEEITGLLFFGNLCVGSIYTSTTLAYIWSS